MPDPSDLVVEPVTRTVAGQTYTLKKIPLRLLWPWLAEEKAARRKQAVADVPTVNVLPLVRQQLVAQAQATGMAVEELRTLILEGPGADRVLRLAAGAVGVPGDKVDDLVESADVTRNLRDGAALSGLFRRDELDGYFPEFADDPVRLIVGALVLSARVNPAAMDVDRRSAAFDAARQQVAAAAEAAGRIIDARQAAANRPVPNDQAPAASSD